MNKRSVFSLLGILAAVLLAAIVMTGCPTDNGGGGYDPLGGGYDPLTYSEDGKTVVRCRSDVSGHVTIPDGVTSIGDGAFSGCTGLTGIIMPDSVTTIGDGAFYGCTSLASITMNGVTSIGYWAFEDTVWYTNQDDGLIYLGKLAYKYKGTMPSNTSITLDSGTISISDYAFYDCYSLTSITIPNSVTSIGDNAFYNCYSLTSITIPNSVTSIGSGAFSYCTGLTSITVAEGNANYASEDGVLFNKAKTTLIQYLAGKTGTEYTIPSSVTSIGSGAFSGCYNLTSITIPDSVTSIGDDTFSNCRGLTSVHIGSGVTSIGSGVFSGCDSLTSITIPSGVTSIGHSAFCNCHSLTSITIPASVTSIDSAAFYWNNKLTSITVDEGNTNYASVNGILFNKAKTTLIRYPEGKTGTTYTIPNSVTSIGDYAFHGCNSLTSITIQASVTSIGYSAFYACTGLTSVTFATGSNIKNNNFSSNAFPEGDNGWCGDSLKTAYLSYGAGTYTRERGGYWN